jgi:hypothetical protein
MYARCDPSLGSDRASTRPRLYDPGWEGRARELHLRVFESRFRFGDLGRERCEFLLAYAGVNVIALRRQPPNRCEAVVYGSAFTMARPCQ